MGHTPPKTNIPIPNHPFDSEDKMAQEEARVLRQQRESSGGLSDESAEAPVQDSKPYKNLRGT